MGCLDEGVVLAFVGGELQGTELASVEAHLVGCPACAALVAVAAPIAPPGVPGKTRRLDSVTVGRYQLRRLVGRGGMGEVYASHDPELDRRVAIKILRSDSRNPETHRARFMREAQAVARLHHPNVVGIYDVGQAGGRIFLAMELIEGETLAVWCASRPHTVAEILRVFCLAGSGLQAAHQAGIIHRDFKPQNVMIARDGSPRVMDFGLAASAEPGPAEEPRLTMAGSILGTPHYMSPEQLAGQRADARADQFSFCVALWEALHGALPFPAKTWNELRAAVQDGKPRPGPRARRVPRQVQAALLRGLAIDREQRFPGMADLLAALSPGRVPGWPRALGAAATMLAASAIVAGLVVTRTRARRAAACDPTAQLAEVWGSPGAGSPRTAAQEAFAAAVDVPDAVSRFARLSALLDRATQRWGTLWRESCESLPAGTTAATSAERSPPDERVAELERACLDRWRRELRALSQVLAHADARVARRAMAAVAGLREPDTCRDPAVLRAMPPLNPNGRARIDPLLDTLLALRAQAASGHDAPALQAARTLLPDVRRAGDGPLLAETLVVTGRIQSPFDPDAAVPLFEEAYRAGQSNGLPAVAAEAAVQLAFIHGAVQHRFAETDRWLGLTEIAVAHAPGPAQPRLRGWFLEARGAAAAARGQWRQARADFTAAIAAREQDAGPHPEVGLSLVRLAGAAAMVGDAPAALAAASRAVDALAALFPPDSYEVGAAQLARARARLAGGQLREAATDAEAARAALERALGRDHPFLADPLTVRGELALARGDAARARQLLEPAWEMRSTQLADAGVREETGFALARAIWITAGDRAHALELAREARDGYATFPDLAGRQAAVAEWIAGHPDPKSGHAAP